MEAAAVDIEAPQSNDLTVCVMDASSYVGSRIVKGLLERGYTVHAFETYDNIGEVERFNVLPANRLQRFRNSNNITHALMGCSGLFYNFQLPPNMTAYNEEMIQIEEEAAFQAMAACTQIPSITKFVLTSSLATAIWRQDEILIDHRTMSDEDYCRREEFWYALAKRAAERAIERNVIQLREENPQRRFKEMTINAALIVDSHMDFRNTGSFIPYWGSIFPYLDKPQWIEHMLYAGTFAIVSINFLVDAHICVYETPNANVRGRYLCFDEMVSSAEDSTRLADRLEPVRRVQFFDWLGSQRLGPMMEFIHRLIWLRSNRSHFRQENYIPRLNGERLTALMA